jgi:lysophospholipase L1-like esterase
MAMMTTFRRYVAIGDSATEGLYDLDHQGHNRGFADRLAQHIADGQDEPLEYANLAIRGLRMREIRTSQLDDALAMSPDLLTVIGGMNDVIAPRCDFDAIRADYVIVFGEARRAGCTVLTFTMPDPAAINPLGAQLRERVNRLNAIIRSEAAPRGVLVMDFEAYPVATDPRLWFEDRWHVNSLGHTKVAEALAWRLGIAGFDESWADPLDAEPAPTPPRAPITGDVDWAVRHLLPWVGKGIRRLPGGLGIDRKRPVPTIVPRSRQHVD